MEWATCPPFGEIVSRFAAYRGITGLSGLVLAAEVFDWRRFPTAPMFMGFTGLTPTESSSGAVPDCCARQFGDLRAKLTP